MTEGKLTPEAVQIAKAIAAARSSRRFRPRVTKVQLKKSTDSMKEALAVIDTWEEIAQFGGEKILDWIVNMGLSYLRSGGLDMLAKVASQGVEPLQEYLKEKVGDIVS
jgi:hypothetical protein